MAGSKRKYNEQIVESSCILFSSNIEGFFLYMPVFAFTSWLFHDKRNGTILTMGFYTTLFFPFTLF
jgi:hypothetical protein